MAVFALRMSTQAFSEMWAQIDGLQIVFKVDCLRVDELENQSLKDKIISTGVLFYAEKQ